MEEATATAHGFYDYLKLLMDYFSIWSVIVLIGIIWVLRKPDALGHLAKHVESAKFGDFELKLRAIEQKLEDTEALVEELEAENSRLSALYEDFDVHAPVSELAPTRERLRALAGNLEDTQPILDGLKPGASAGDVYAAAEILRARRDFGLFDQLVRNH